MWAAPSGLFIETYGVRNDYRRSRQVYELNEQEQRTFDDIKARIASDGGLYRMDRFGDYIRDGNGNMVRIPFEVLRPRRRFCVDGNGRLWRFAAQGSPKDADDPTGGGAPWRCHMVEMWSGHWRKVKQPDGTHKYAKSLLWVPVGQGVNQHEGISHIDWYLSSKGFKHPYDPPDRPSDTQIRILEQQETNLHHAVYANMDEMAKAQGMKPEELRKIVVEQEEERAEPVKAQKARKRRKRTNKRPRAESPTEQPVASPPEGVSDVA